MSGMTPNPELAVERFRELIDRMAGQGPCLTTTEHEQGFACHQHYIDEDGTPKVKYIPWEDFYA